MKKVLTCLLVFCMVLSLAACSFVKKPSNETTNSSVSEQTPDSKDPIDVPADETTSETELEESKTEDKSTTTSKDESKPSEKLDSDDWTKLSIAIEGKVFEFPYSYENLKTFGYDFDIADYGYKDGYILNPKDKVSGTIRLINPDLDKYDSASISIGFQNFSDKAKDIKECDIWTLEISNLYGTKKLVKNKLDFELAKGIKSGSTLDEITKAYGKADDTYDADEYIVLTYNNDYSEYMRLTVHNEFGLVGVELKMY